MNPETEFPSSTPPSPRPARKNSSLLKLLLALSCVIASVATAAPMAQVQVLMTKPLPNIPGKEATMLLVTYPPGAQDPVHRHNASTFVYVLEGTVVMQMKGGRPVTLRPGQTFYEDPRGIHQVGRNASDKVPAKFIVVLVKDKGAPILVPVKK